MSSNCNVDITRPFNDIDLAGKYIVKSSDFFDIIGNIEERLEKIASRFSSLDYAINKGFVYNDISFCFRDIANVLKEIKKKKGLRNNFYNKKCNYLVTKI